jgi:oxygen-independent coproporphyrinogen-3 oxidase
MGGLLLYIHIPFCIRKCRYCDFYSLPVGDGFIGGDDVFHRDDSHLINRYINALIDEWELYGNDVIFGDNPINTIYIGGGTPSILNVDMWEMLDKGIFFKIDKSNLKEWSIECNPESFTIEKAEMYASSGVTRLTFGVQSLNTRELSVCGRAHSAERALEVLGDSRLPTLFNSIGADIIYSLPGQTVNTLDNTLSSLLSISHVKHISAYELTIANNTPFGRHKKILNLPNDETSAEMYNLIGKRCADRGMRQYEVSNYALPGFESLHNKAYWSRMPYIGLGASAHSYIPSRRWGNIADVDKYISSILTTEKAIDFEETLSPPDISLEIIFLGLRNADGIDEDDFCSQTGTPFFTDTRKPHLQKYLSQGLLKKSSNKWIPTSKGMLFADMMARELGR